MVSQLATSVHSCRNQGLSNQGLSQARPVWVFANGPSCGHTIAAVVRLLRVRSPMQQHFPTARLSATSNAYHLLRHTCNHAAPWPADCRFTLNLAMANDTGIAHFSRECTSEQCSLDAKSKHNYDLIYTSTVDAFLRKHEIDFVDVLKVCWHASSGPPGQARPGQGTAHG